MSVWLFQLRFSGEWKVGTVGSRHFRLQGSGRVPLMPHYPGVVVVDGVLWIQEGHVHAGMLARFGVPCDLVLALYECS